MNAHYPPQFFYLILKKTMKQINHAENYKWHICISNYQELALNEMEKFG